jgi:23S rRNA (cytosine1962-C5)-methyltransferase
VSPELILRAGRERSVLRRHPWIFSGSVADLRGSPGPGETVDVRAASGEWLARAAYSPEAQIAARIWTWDPEDQVDRSFFERRLRSSLDARAALSGGRGISGYREVHAESDGLPGLIADRYAGVRVVQFLSQGAERWRGEILEALTNLSPVAGVFERSDTDARQLEGLPARAGLLAGDVPERVEIEEDGLTFLVDVRRGQKTGFYLDQRDSRAWIRRNAPAAGRVLDAFCYTGSFTVAALKGSARSCFSVDSSGEALSLGRANVVRNGLDDERCLWKEANVFEELRALRDRGDSFDLVILDPPRLAPAASHVPRAARAYKDMNRLGLKLLRPGGQLMSFSCSSGVSPELFQRIVAGAALDADVDAQIVAWLGQPADHPVRLSFPEGRYLKGLVVRRMDV